MLPLNTGPVVLVRDAPRPWPSWIWHPLPLRPPRPWPLPPRPPPDDVAFDGTVVSVPTLPCAAGTTLVAGTLSLMLLMGDVLGCSHYCASVRCFHCDPCGTDLDDPSSWLKVVECMDSGSGLHLRSGMLLVQLPLGPLLVWR